MPYSEPVYDEANEKWVVNIYFDNGNLKKSLEYDTEEEAIKDRGDRITEAIKSDEKAIVKKEKDKIVQKSTFLEEMAGFGDGGESMETLPSDDIFGGETEEELQKKIDDHKDEFDAEEAKCVLEAKNLLLQVAQVYLDGDFVKNSEYLKFKLALEEKGLAGLVFQLNITRRAVFKLSEKIATNEASPRHFEVLTGMNRVILDITKYQHEHLRKLEESMKRFQVDNEEAQSRKGVQGDGDNEVIDAEGTIIDTRDRRKLLGVLNDIIEEAKEAKIPKSRNTKLHDDDPNVEDIVQSDGGDEISSDDEDLGEEGGLTSWSDNTEEENGEQEDNR